MIHTGLVSVTFRQLGPSEIVDLVKRAGLKGIEWGGDIHVPAGNIRYAADIHKMTEDAGLQVAAYGSYYKAGCETNIISFEKVLETAVALHAPTVRIWAGDRGSENADSTWEHRVIKDSRRIAALAEQASINVAFEYHEETLTDTSKSACRLLHEIDLTNVMSYWQPPVALNFDERMTSLREILPWLSNIHVFTQSGVEPDPLADGITEWMQYIDVVQGFPDDRFCMLEFVKGGLINQFFEDAATLKNICG